MGLSCSTRQKNNIVLIHSFKDYCALLFMQGALLEYTQGILVQQISNVYYDYCQKLQGPKKTSSIIRKIESNHGYLPTNLNISIDKVFLN